MRARKSLTIQTAASRNGFGAFARSQNAKRKLFSAHIGRQFLIWVLYDRNKDEVTADRLSEADLVIFGGPRDLFSVAEFKEIKAWLSNGGRAIFLFSDGGEKASGCNINYFLEE